MVIYLTDYVTEKSGNVALAYIMLQPRPFSAEKQTGRRSISGQGSPTLAEHPSTIHNCSRKHDSEIYS